MLPQVRLVASPREWVERESADVHLWLSVAADPLVKHVDILVTCACVTQSKLVLQVTPFRASCGTTERQWVACPGAQACIRRSGGNTGSLPSAGSSVDKKLQCKSRSKLPLL